MTLQDAIDNPAVNVFDIIPDKSYPNGLFVKTYFKPNDTLKTWEKRHMKNIAKANWLKFKEY